VAVGEGVGCRSDTPWCEPADHGEPVDKRGRLVSGGPWSMLGRYYMYINSVYTKQRLEASVGDRQQQQQQQQQQEAQRQQCANTMKRQNAARLKDSECRGACARPRKGGIQCARREQAQDLREVMSGLGLGGSRCDELIGLLRHGAQALGGDSAERCLPEPEASS